MRPLALALLPLLAVGCQQIEAWRDQGRLPIVYVDIPERFLEAEGHPEARAQAEAALTAVMKAWPDFAFRTANTGEVGWQLTVRVPQATEREADDHPELLHRSVGVQLLLRAVGKVERDPSQVAVESLFTADVPKATPFGETVAAAIEDAGRRMQVAMDLAWGPDAGVLEGLKSEQEWRRLLAVDAAGQRRLAAAAPALIALVRDPEQPPNLVVAGVGALVAMRATDAAGAIIDACRDRPAEYVVQMIYALGALGGREAEAYLFTVQSGHPHPEVRAAAAQALEELSRKAGAE
ncbi:MAG: hypothetical protein H6730_02795 [Deltaproteobacteria bacterium]|nr:hypothetical protein [Deltaproteobacteria bacterium]